MRRTFSSRFINVGRIDTDPGAVDKPHTPGAAYNDPDRIEAELRGEHSGACHHHLFIVTGPGSATCPDCGRDLEPGARADTWRAKS